MAKYVREEYWRELEALGRELPEFKRPFKRYAHAEAVKIVNEYGCVNSPREELRWECEKLFSALHTSPVFIYDYPKGSRGFYDREDPERPGVLRDFDMGAVDDLRLHIQLSNGLFRRYLGASPLGVWPPEQAVNDEVLRLFAEEGYLWTVTDEDVLKMTMPGKSHFQLYYADYGGRRIYVFFRDKTLSDNIGFRYSSMCGR